MIYRLASEDSSATANQDYTPLFAINDIVITPADGTTKNVPVNIRNDDLFEKEENFRLRLSSTDSSVRITGNNPVNVFITDNDGMMYCIFKNIVVVYVDLVTPPVSVIVVINSHLLHKLYFAVFVPGLTRGNT